MYLSKQIDEMASTAVGRSAEISKMKELLYSPEFLARAKTGKSAATASVEAIVMNTNLLDLVEKEALGEGKGAERARDLFERLYKGTHVSDTDAILQSYVGKYINAGIRDESDPFSLKVVDAKTRSGFSSLVRGAQSKVFRSSAITLTTNIADVTQLSENVFNFISGQKISNVELLVSGQDLIDAKILSKTPEGITNSIEDLLEENTRKLQGILGFDEESGRRVFRVGDLDPIYLDNESANNYVGKIIREAKNVPTVDRPLVSATGVATDFSVKVNTSAEKILDLGLDYQQASQMDELDKISRAVSVPSDLTVGKVTPSSEKLLGSLGKTYELLSTGTPIFSAMRGEAEFTPGLGNATAKTAIELAQAAIDIGSPHILLSNQSRMFSTMVSQATSNHLGEARERALQLSMDESLSSIDREKYAKEADLLRYAKHKDLLSEYGVSHFKSGTKASIVQQATIADEAIRERIFLPLQAVKQAVSKETFEAGNFSLSVARVSNKDQLNVFWHMAQMGEKDNSREVAESIHKYIMGDREDLINVDKQVEKKINEELAKAQSDMSAVKIHLKEQLKSGTPGMLDEDAAKEADKMVIDTIEQRIKKGGIGVAFAGEKETENFVRSANRAGIEINNDTFLQRLRALFVSDSSDGADIRLTGFSDQLVQESSVASKADMENAQKVLREDRMGAISDAAGADPNAERIMRLRQKRRMIGMQANDFLEKLILNKSGIKQALAGIAVAGIGYYGYNKYKDSQEYNETIEDQPIEGYSAKLEMGEKAPQRMESRRRDPLVTAGIVGNLDRNKISHYRMGNDKYNHLYSGV